MTARPIPLGGLRGVVLRRAVWVGLVAVLAFGGGLAARQGHPPLYESTALLTVTSTTFQDTQSTARAAQAAARMVTYRDVVSAELETAGQDAAAADPRLHLRVQASPNSPLVTISGLAADPEAARATTDAAARALTHRAVVGPFDVVQLVPAVAPESTQTSAWALPFGFGAVAAGMSTAVALVLPVRPRRRRLLPVRLTRGRRVSLAAGSGAGRTAGTARPAARPPAR